MTSNNTYQHLIIFSKIYILQVYKKLITILYPIFDEIVKDFALYIILKYLLLVLIYEANIAHNSYLELNHILKNIKYRIFKYRIFKYQIFKTMFITK